MGHSDLWKRFEKRRLSFPPPCALEGVKRIELCSSVRATRTPFPCYSFGLSTLQLCFGPGSDFSLVKIFACEEFLDIGSASAVSDPIAHCGRVKTRLPLWIFTLWVLSRWRWSTLEVIALSSLRCCGKAVIILLNQECYRGFHYLGGASREVSRRFFSLHIPFRGSFIGSPSDGAVSVLDILLFFSFLLSLTPKFWFFSSHILCPSVLEDGRKRFRLVSSSGFKPEFWHLGSVYSLGGVWKFAASEATWLNPPFQRVATSAENGTWSSRVCFEHYSGTRR
ncbi:hypothetical protein Bca4012_025190 [Brassica carinata]